MPPRRTQRNSETTSRESAGPSSTAASVESVEQTSSAQAAPSQVGAEITLVPEGSHGFVSCIVTPKLTFNVPRKPAWRCVGDIPQCDLRNAFALRFPPDIGLDFDKYTFRAATPACTELTEQTRTLVFKVVSENLAEDRVLLSILNELERGYESKIKNTVEQMFASESLSFQSLVDEVRTAQDKQGKELTKHNRDLKDQMQTIQKRVFLLEQEKDSLQKGQQDLKAQLKESKRSSAEQLKSVQDENAELRAELESFKVQLHDSRKQSDQELQTLKDENAELKSEVANMNSQMQTLLTQRATDADLLKKLERKTVAKQSWADASCSPRGEDSAKVANLEHRVEELTAQLTSLHDWLRQGSSLFTPHG